MKSTKFPPASMHEAEPLSNYGYKSRMTDEGIALYVEEPSEEPGRC